MTAPDGPSTRSRPRRVVVTGGSGFMGLNIVERLLAAGHEAVIFDISVPPERARRDFAVLPGVLRFAQGDIQDPDALNAAFDEPADAVVHAAAITADAAREMESPGRIVGVNVGGAVNLARVAAARQVPRTLLVSSAAVYGDSPDLSEDGVLRPRSLYAVTKHAAEGALARLADLHGFDLVVARLGWMYGPWEYASGARDTLSAVYQMTTAALAGRSVSVPRPDRRDWMYSRDAAAAVVRLLGAEGRRHQVYNIAPDRSWELADWAAMLGRVRPHFRYNVGGVEADQRIELHTIRNPTPLPGARFSAEFGSPIRFPPERAFSDYMSWLRSDPWPMSALCA